MSFDLSTAVALDALGTQIAAATGPDSSLEAQMLSLITEPMQTIDGRSPATGFRYTLNVTNALQLRAKHWYMRGLMEIGEANQPFAGCGLEYMPQLGFVQGGVNSNGASLGLAVAAAICHSWAEIIRRYLANNYPVAVPAA